MKNLIICFSVSCIIAAITNLFFMFSFRGSAYALILMALGAVNILLEVVGGLLLLNYMKSKFGKFELKINSKIAHFFISLMASVLVFVSFFIPDLKDFLNLDAFIKENFGLFAMTIHAILDNFIFLIVVYLIGLILYFRIRVSNN